jgi:hypothetical protein
MAYVKSAKPRLFLFAARRRQPRPRRVVGLQALRHHGQRGAHRGRRRRPRARATPRLLQPLRERDVRLKRIQREVQATRGASYTQEHARLARVAREARDGVRGNQQHGGYRRERRGRRCCCWRIIRCDVPPRRRFPFFSFGGSRRWPRPSTAGGGIVAVSLSSGVPRARLACLGVVAHAKVGGSVRRVQKRSQSLNCGSIVAPPQNVDKFFATNFRGVPSSACRRPSLTPRRRAAANRSRETRRALPPSHSISGRRGEYTRTPSLHKSRERHPVPFVRLQKIRSRQSQRFPFLNSSLLERAACGLQR